MQQELPELFPIPTFNNLYITKDARVYLERNSEYKELKQCLLTKKAAVIKSYVNYWDHGCQYNVFRLFAMTFTPKEDHKRIAMPLDNNFLNITLENVSWRNVIIQSREDRLNAYLLEKSVSTNWNVAKTEWELTDVTYNGLGQYCPCGQHIKNVCRITNSETKEIVEIGNNCVLKFADIRTGYTFDSIKRLIKDPANSKPNNDLIETAFKCDYIYQSEYNFLMSIKNKRKLSYKQQAWLTKINHRILNKTTITQ